MKLTRLTTLSFLASMAFGVTACHQEAEMSSGEGTSTRVGPRDGMGILSFRNGFPNITPVKKVRYIVTPLDPSGTSLNVVVDLKHNLALPGGLKTFEKKPLDKDSRHRFTDLFEEVKPGKYNVAVIPLDAAGNPVEDCAGASTRTPMTAVAGMVTEQYLMMNCRGQDPAEINVVAAINHEPKLSVDFVRETKLTHSKFTCENRLDVCLTAHDIDNDPLRFELTSPNPACKIEVSLTPAQNPPAVPCTEITQCYTVSCPGFIGKADLKARVYDQVWSGNTKIDIETWLAGNSQVSGTPIESHAGLKFWGYYQDPKKCNPCPDCPPDARAPFSYVLLQDLSDSIRPELPAIKNDIQSLVLSLESDTTAMLNSECPLQDSAWVSVPNGGVASFIDRPKLPFGNPGDYVFKVERGSKGDDRASGIDIASTFNSLATRDGADNSEGQLQALLAMLGDYSADQRSGGDDDFYLPTPATSSEYSNFAILITKSPYHQSPDCFDKAINGKCTEPNNNSPALGEFEEYPVMTQVAAELKKDNIVPIFLVVKEQGAYQTAPYDAIVNELGGKGLVVRYDPNSTNIRKEITSFVTKTITEKQDICK